MADNGFRQAYVVIQTQTHSYDPRQAARPIRQLIVHQACQTEVFK